MIGRGTHQETTINIVMLCDYSLHRLFLVSVLLPPIRNSGVLFPKYDRQGRQAPHLLKVQHEMEEYRD
jgi:hypothetical protein